MKSDHQEAEYLSHISLLHCGVRLHYYTKALCGTEFTYHGVAIEGVVFFCHNVSCRDPHDIVIIEITIALPE